MYQFLYTVHRAERLKAVSLLSHFSGGSLCQLLYVRHDVTQRTVLHCGA